MEHPSKSSPEVERDEKGRILPGQESINPAGRPPGKSMKEFAREFLLKMTDDKKVAWLKSLGKDIVWRMAEGNPHQTSDEKLEVTLPQPLLGGQSNDTSNNSNKEITEIDEED